MAALEIINQIACCWTWMKDEKVAALRIWRLPNLVILNLHYWTSWTMCPEKWCDNFSHPYDWFSLFTSSFTLSLSLSIVNIFTVILIFVLLVLLCPAPSLLHSSVLSLCIWFLICSRWWWWWCEEWEKDGRWWRKSTVIVIVGGDSTMAKQHTVTQYRSTVWERIRVLLLDVIWTKRSTWLVRVMSSRLTFALSLVSIFLSLSCSLTLLVSFFFSCRLIGGRHFGTHFHVLEHISFSLSHTLLELMEWEKWRWKTWWALFQDWKGQTVRDEDEKE